MKAKHQRLLFVSISVLFLCISALLTMRAFRDNLVFFYSPTDISAHRRDISPTRTIRVGGLVAAGSIKREGDNITFIVTDNTNELPVSYKGMLPNLFREGQGVVAEGHLQEGGHFEAVTILAKHDEKYMPREVVDALKRAGRWKGP